jgi:hypothetical protein
MGLPSTFREDITLENPAFYDSMAERFPFGISREDRDAQYCKAFAQGYTGFFALVGDILGAGEGTVYSFVGSDSRALAGSVPDFIVQCELQAERHGRALAFHKQVIDLPLDTQDALWGSFLHSAGKQFGAVYVSDSLTLEGIVLGIRRSSDARIVEATNYISHWRKYASLLSN